MLIMKIQLWNIYSFYLCDRIYILLRWKFEKLQETLSGEEQKYNNKIL